MRRRSRREVDIFNLSFLDVVSCGFGAIILLLVIVKISEPHVIERLAVDLTGLVQRLEAELFEIRGDTTVLNRELLSKQQQLSEVREKLARLKGDLSDIRGQYSSTAISTTPRRLSRGNCPRRSKACRQRCVACWVPTTSVTWRVPPSVAYRSTANTSSLLSIPPVP